MKRDHAGGYEEMKKLFEGLKVYGGKDDNKDLGANSYTHEVGKDTVLDVCRRFSIIAFRGPVAIRTFPYASHSSEKQRSKYSKYPAIPEDISFIS